MARLLSDVKLLFCIPIVIGFIIYFVWICKSSLELKIFATILCLALSYLAGLGFGAIERMDMRER